MSRPVAVDFFTLFLSLCPQGSSIFLKCHTYLSWSLLLQGHQAPQWIASPTSLAEVLISQAGLIHPPLSHLVLALSQVFVMPEMCCTWTQFLLFIILFPHSSFSWVFTHKQDTKHIIRTWQGERTGPGTGPGARSGAGKGARTWPGERAGTGPGERSGAGTGPGKRTGSGAR